MVPQVRPGGPARGIERARGRGWLALPTPPERAVAAVERQWAAFVCDHAPESGGHFRQVMKKSGRRPVVDPSN